jgi:hypothetical protein
MKYSFLSPGLPLPDSVSFWNNRSIQIKELDKNFPKVIAKINREFCMTFENTKVIICETNIFRGR